MARWVKFTKDYDHRWPNRAVTAFKAGPKRLYVKDEVAAVAIGLGVAEATDAPKPGDVDHETSGTRLESDRRTPVAISNRRKVNKIASNLSDDGQLLRASDMDPERVAPATTEAPRHAADTKPAKA